MFSGFIFTLFLSFGYSIVAEEKTEIFANKTITADLNIVTENPVKEMAVKGTFKVIYPVSIDEIKSCPQDRFMIKIGSEWCGACKSFDNFVLTHNWNLKKDFTLYIVNLHSKSQDAFIALCSKYNCSGIPYILIADNSLNVIEEFRGYNEWVVGNMIQKYFGN